MNKGSKFQKICVVALVMEWSGTLSLGIPYHTCNATKVAKETTIFFLMFFFTKTRSYYRSQVIHKVTVALISSPRNKIPWATF